MSSLIEILQKAISHSSFYRDLGIRTAELQEFPVISRTIFKTHLFDILTSEGHEKTQIWDVLNGTTVPDNQARGSQSFFALGELPGFPLGLAMTIKFARKPSFC